MFKSLGFLFLYIFFVSRKLEVPSPAPFRFSDLCSNRFPCSRRVPTAPSIGFCQRKFRTPDPLARVWLGQGRGGGCGGSQRGESGWPICPDAGLGGRPGASPLFAPRPQRCSACPPCLSPRCLDFSSRCLVSNPRRQQRDRASRAGPGGLGCPGSVPSSSWAGSGVQAEDQACSSPPASLDPDRRAPSTGALAKMPENGHISSGKGRHLETKLGPAETTRKERDWTPWILSQACWPAIWAELRDFWGVNWKTLRQGHRIM